MSANQEDKILKEIRRRAFARSDALHLEHECTQATNNTLDALELFFLPNREIPVISLTRKVYRQVH